MPQPVCHVGPAGSCTAVSESAWSQEHGSYVHRGPGSLRAQEETRCRPGVHGREELLGEEEANPMPPISPLLLATGFANRLQLREAGRPRLYPVSPPPLIQFGFMCLNPHLRVVFAWIFFFF